MVKLEEFMEIFKLKEQGLTISAISRETSLDHKTVRKNFQQGKSCQPSSKKCTINACELHKLIYRLLDN